MKQATNTRPIYLLLVEDNPGDVRLTVETIRESEIPARLHVVRDGEEALAFLRREGGYADAPCPDLILLDLNLPRMDGQEVLAIIKADLRLQSIPAVVLTVSDAEHDVLRAYEWRANCYLTKPLDLDKFIALVETFENFWLARARLLRGTMGAGP